MGNNTACSLKSEAYPQSKPMPLGTLNECA